jgi:hypothetical protein
VRPRIYGAGLGRTTICRSEAPVGQLCESGPRGALSGAFTHVPALSLARDRFNYGATRGGHSGPCSLAGLLVVVELHRLELSLESDPVRRADPAFPQCPERATTTFPSLAMFTGIGDPCEQHKDRRMPQMLDCGNTFAALPRCFEGEELPGARNAFEFMDAIRKELEPRADGEVAHGA